MHQFLTSGYNLQVELEVHGDGGTRTLLLERRALPLPPMKTRLLDTGDGHLVAYLRLHYFTHEGTKKMAAAIREGEALGVDGYSMYAVLFVPPTCIDPSHGCMLELSSWLINTCNYCLPNFNQNSCTCSSGPEEQSWWSL